MPGTRTGADLPKHRDAVRLETIENYIVKKALADALENRGYTTLTPVQEAVTNPDLIGVDLLVSAQTGSGKTLGFGLAIAPSLLGEEETFGAAAAPLALVIAPTRELALQVKRELSWLFANAGAHVTSCVGGMDMRDERRALARGAHIVVATPGRLRDHIMRGSINMGALRAVVLDEADEMLDLGFREDLEFILGEAPEDRQTLMFSATVPASIGKLAKSYQRDAVRVTTKSDSSPHADIDYRAYTVADRDAENAIINTLRYYEAPNTIVFANTRAMVGRLTTRLSNRGFSVVALSGELSQSERTHALQAMRDGRARVCVATDVAARGIDLPNLDLVVHAELPSNHETLLHRSGRTGRAGRKGVSTLIVPPKARSKAQRILKFAKLTAEWSGAPTAEEVRARDQERMLSDPVWTEEIAESDQGAVDNLVSAFTPQQLAAAYLGMYHAKHSPPEELSGVDEKPKPRAAFGASVWFSVEGGRAAGAEPRRLLPMLCKAGGLTKDDIGAIRIQQEASFVEILETSVAGFLSAVGPSMTIEEDAIVRLDKPPSFAKGPSGGGAPRGPAPRGPKPDRKPAYNKGPDSERYRPAADTPHPAPAERPAPSERPAPKTAGTTKPVDWNDAPEPRSKKPKPGSKPSGKFGGHPAKAKPRHKPEGAHAKDHDGAVVAKRKFDGPKGKPGGKPTGKPAGKPTGKPTDFKRSKSAELSTDGPRGPKPPAGKASSKKNRARAASAKLAGKAGGKPGGSKPPRRSKP